MGSAARAHRSLWVTVAVLLASVVVALGAPAASAAQPSHASGWGYACGFVKTSTDDPIFDFGMPGAAPVHDFYGDRRTDAFSTYRTLRHARTRCWERFDHSAYWHPQLELDGKPVPPNALRVDYLATRGSDPALVQPFPVGLAMVASEFVFTCIGEGLRAPHEDAPFDCTPWPSSEVGAIVSFPACWDGVGIDPPDHVSHMAYADRTGCPPDHPIPVPHLVMTVTWHLQNGLGAVLSTGGPGTMSAEFLDGWSVRGLAALVDVCINLSQWCGLADQRGQVVATTSIVTKNMPMR